MESHTRKYNMQLFLDCDGVLADFDTFAASIFGMHPRDFEDLHGDEKFWKALNSVDNFFEQLPLMHDAMHLWEATQKFNPIILTGVPKEMPEAHEQIWDYGTMIWDQPLEIKKITARELDFNLCHQYDVEGVEDLFDRMEPVQHDIVNNYINDPNLSNYIIVLDNGHIVDGNHRAIAAALTGKSLRYVDIGEE